VTDKATHIRTYEDMWGLRLEVALSQLTPAQRTLLRKRVNDAVYRIGQKLAWLSVVLLVLDRKPLEQDIIDRFKEE